MFEIDNTDIRNYLIEYYYNFDKYDLIRTRNYIRLKYNQIYNMIKDNNIQHKFVEKYTDLNYDIACGNNNFDIDFQLSLVKLIKRIIDQNNY